MPRTGTWWLYVLECHRGVLYTGIAKDVDARFAAHLSGTGAKFTRLNPPLPRRQVNRGSKEPAIG